MNRTRSSHAGIFSFRALFAFGLCSVGLLLGLLSPLATPALARPAAGPRRILTDIPSTVSNRRVGHVPIVDSRATIEGHFEEKFFLDVTCTAPSDCWSVGGVARDAGKYRTFIEHWDGTRWLMMASPNGNQRDNSLNGVACISASDCWAVGTYNVLVGDGDHDVTLIEHWDGTSWSIVPSPNGSSTQTNRLNSVTCTSTSDCWAVGTYTLSDQDRPLIEHWDGTSWLIVSAPFSSPEDNQLWDVTCLSPSDCWAVGDLFFETLIEHWNGNAWSIVASPSPGKDRNTLYGVTCVSSSDCWAVGFAITAGAADKPTLIEKWDGNVWTVVASPEPEPGNSAPELHNVACASSSDCWAVGVSSSVSSIEHWDGIGWAIHTVLGGTGSPPTRLLAVVCASSSDCWAVGYTGGDNTFPYRSLTEHWDGSSWVTVNTPFLITGIVSRKIHGTTGPFDINLPQTGPAGIECRFGTPTGDFQMVFTFGTDLASVGGVSVNAGSVSSSSIGPEPNQYVVNLTGVPNAQYVTVTLNAVQDVDGGTGDASGTMGMLRGDTNGNGVVNSTDLAQTKSRIGQPIDTSTFRSDIQANGSVNAADISLVKFNMGSALP